MSHLSKNAKVSWHTPQGKTHGTIVDIITAPTERDGHHVAASNDEPHYEVESAKSGKRAVHKGSALTEEE